MKENIQFYSLRETVNQFHVYFTILNTCVWPLVSVCDDGTHTHTHAVPICISLQVLRNVTHVCQFIFFLLIFQINENKWSAVAMLSVNVCVCVFRLFRTHDTNKWMAHKIHIFQENFIDFSREAFFLQQAHFWVMENEKEYFLYATQRTQRTHTLTLTHSLS